MVWGRIGGTTYELTANAQIWPRSQNSVLGGDEGKIYLIVADMGSPSGQGLDFISAYFSLAFWTRWVSNVTSTGRRLRVLAALLQRVRHRQRPGRPRHDGIHGRDDELNGGSAD